MVLKSASEKVKYKQIYLHNNIIYLVLPVSVGESYF